MLRFIFLLFLMINVNAAHAQSPRFADLPPLHFISERQIYQWTPDNEVAPVGDPLPETLMAYYPSPSDDVLLLEVRIEQDSPTLIPLSELIMLDLTTGERTQIAPPSMERSTPIWSPGGDRIAWTEGTDSRHLILYDRAAGITSTISTDLPAPSFAPIPTPLIGWGFYGIVVEEVTLDQELLTASIAGFRLYAEDGTFKTIPHPFPHDSERARYIIVSIPASGIFVDGDRHEVLLTFPFGGLYTTSGEIVRVGGRNVGSSLRVYPPIYRADPLNTYLTPIRSDETAYTPVIGHGGISFTMEGASVLVSPDGSAVVQNRRSRELMGWHREIGEFTVSLPVEPEILFWGLPHLIGDGGGSRVVVNGRCESGLHYDIQAYPDQLAFINGNEPRPLYQAAYLDAGSWMDVPPGTIVRVSEGFLCGVATIGMVGGIRMGAWREVQVGDTIGWMPEAMGETYWLTPLCPPRGCEAG